MSEPTAAPGSAETTVRPGAPAPAVPVARIVGAVLRRPRLWPAAVAEAARLARPGWWHRWPPVPAPTPELWRFRMITAYGGAGDGVPDVDDVVTFLRWAGRMRHWRKG